MSSADAAPPAKKTKLSPSSEYLVTVRKPDVFASPSFTLRAKGKTFAGGNLYTPKGKDVELHISCKVAIGYQYDEEYDRHTFAIKPKEDSDAYKKLRALDKWVKQVVATAGDVPESAKHYALMRDNGWVNFKIKPDAVSQTALPTGEDWTSLSGGLKGTLVLKVNGIWRSQGGMIPDGYGLMLKPLHFMPTSDDDDEEA